MARTCLFLVSLLFVFSCSKEKESIPETATSGTLKIAFDNSYAPIVKQEEVIFQYLYKYATIIDTIVPQEKTHELFLKDSVKAIFSSRNLNKNELAYLKSKNVYPKIYEFAYDGLALLVNLKTKDSVVSIQTLKELVKGTNKKNILVVDKGNGGAILSFVDLLGISNEEVKQIFSADSIQGVIDYVAANEEAMGLVGGAWLSDTESPKVRKMMENVRVMKVSSGKSSIGYHPFQSEIADSLYPLRRTIYLITRESKMGLANGFASFLLGEKGQRVVLKAGLLPSRIPGREVLVSSKNSF